MTKEESLKKLYDTPVNWSSISSFRWNKENWFRNFILGERATSPEMTFGSYIDKKIQNDPNFMPKLPRFEMMQHHMKVVFNGLTLMGTPDGINIKKNKMLIDYKTGVKEWNKKRAEEHGQLLMYLLLIYITMKIRPEEFDCYIYWLPTKKEEDGNFDIKVSLISETDFKTFKCKHTMTEILKFGTYIKETFKEMEEYIKNMA